MLYIYPHLMLYLDGADKYEFNLVFKSHEYKRKKIALTKYSDGGELKDYKDMFWIVYHIYNLPHNLRNIRIECSTYIMSPSRKVS